MRTHEAIIAAAGAALIGADRKSNAKDLAVAHELGVANHMPRDWRIRNSIPPAYWSAIVAKGWATTEELIEAVERKAQARVQSPAPA